MKVIKVTLASFLALLFTTAVSMESPLDNGGLQEHEKSFCSQMFGQTKQITLLSQQQRQVAYPVFVQAFRLFLSTICEQMSIATHERTDQLFITLFSNVRSILDDPKDTFISNQGEIELEPFSKLFSQPCQKALFSLYLIPAWKTGDNEIVKALISSGASIRTLKQIAQAIGEEESQFIETLALNCKED